MGTVAVPDAVYVARAVSTPFKKQYSTTSPLLSDRLWQPVYVVRCACAAPRASENSTAAALEYIFLFRFLCLVSWRTLLYLSPVSTLVSPVSGSILAVVIVEDFFHRNTKR